MNKQNSFIIAIIWLISWSIAVAGPGNSSPQNANLVANATSVYIDKATGLRMHQGKTFTGTMEQHHKTGNLKKSESFKAGKRHGLVNHWFENGVLGFESHYQIGRRHGTTKSWWNNGNLRSETHYQNDHAEGVAWRWYSTGEKYKKFNYTAGVPAGLQQGWRMNGKLFSNFEYRNGRAYGLRNSNLCVQLEDEAISAGKLGSRPREVKNEIIN